MKRLLLAMMVLGSAHALAAQTETLPEKSGFQPAETLSVADITDSFFSVASGTVVLDALIGETGKVQGVEVRRDIASLTQPAVQAVEDWKFSPATLAGKAVASRIPVAVTFRQPCAVSAWVPLPALIPQTDAAIQAEFQPAEVTYAVFPNYPSTTVAVGTVVLEVTLSAAGKAAEVKVLRDITPLTDEVKAVVGDWRFMAATFNGRPIPSKIVLSFVFREVISTDPCV